MRGGALRGILGMLGTGVVVIGVIVWLVASGAWNRFCEDWGEVLHCDSSVTVSDLSPASATPKAGGGILDGILPRKQTASPAPSPSASVSVQGHYGDALALARTLPEATPVSTGYDRDAKFGSWVNSAELCGKGTTRDAILKRDLTAPILNSDCQVTAGLLHDPYTGRDIPFKRGGTTSADVQIDHVVALLDAWASGARDWTQERRKEYANDPLVLLASDGPSNMSKAEGIELNGSTKRWGRVVWLPDNTAYHCEYMSKRVTIKNAYGLSLSPQEKAETVALLSSCPA
jgi:hypothetical protein